MFMCEMDHTTKSRCLNLSAAIVIRIVNAALRAAMKRLCASHDVASAYASETENPGRAGRPGLLTDELRLF
jgi:hypothetical protein